MSSSSMSESCPSGATNLYQISLPDLEKKTESVIKETKELETKIDTLRYLQEKIDEFRCMNTARTEEAKEKMTEISNRITAAGKNMVASCEESYKNLAELAHPYINSGVVPKEHGSLTVLERCIQLQGSIRGLGEAMDRTKAIGPIVMSQHNQLFSLEAKQRGAVDRQKKMANIKRLANEYPKGSLFHLLAALPAFLMRLERNEKISEYYQKKFEGMENEIFSFFESLIHVEPSNLSGHGNLLTTQSRTSNGEVTLESIRDLEEFPLDSTQTFTSVGTN